MKKIIIADPELIHRELLAKSLEFSGFEICRANNEQELKELSDDTIDLFLIDINIGHNAIVNLLELNNGKKPLFLLSTGQYLEAASALLSKGVIDYFLKPYKIELIRNRIKYIFEYSDNNGYRTDDFHRMLMDHKIHEFKILIVDDNEMNRDMLERRVKRLGFIVDTAVNGIQALDKINENSYKLVLLDIMMPEMDGFDVLNELKKKENFKNLQTIMLTALNDKANVKKALDLGADDFIVKPFNFEQVKSRIMASIAKHF